MKSALRIPIAMPGARVAIMGTVVTAGEVTAGEVTTGEVTTGFVTTPVIAPVTGPTTPPAAPLKMGAYRYRDADA